MSDSERAQQIKNLIRKHLNEVGAAEWKAVQILCPEISGATFWRYIKAVREEGNKAGDHDEPAASPCSQADGGVPSVGALPAFYHPLQKARQYEALLSDAEALRSHAVDRGGKITNARQFEKSILLRERLLSQQARMMDFFQNQETNQLFYDELIEIVNDLPEETVQKFMRRLDEHQQGRLSATPA
jgi:hypothetical protein